MDVTLSELFSISQSVERTEQGDGGRALNPEPDRGL